MSSPDPYPTEDPIKIEHLANGERRVFYKDSTILLPQEPMYVLSYATWVVDGDARDWYEIPISMTGVMYEDRQFFEAWNFKIDARRSYRFDKVLQIEEIGTGNVFTPQQLCDFIGGRMVYPLFCEDFGVDRACGYKKTIVKGGPENNGGPYRDGKFIDFVRFERQ